MNLGKHGKRKGGEMEDKKKKMREKDDLRPDLPHANGDQFKCTFNFNMETHLN